jgi:hypothetical protein
MLQTFRIPQEDVQQFSDWAKKQGMDAIAFIPADDGTAISLFRADRPFTNRDIAKSGVYFRMINLPQYNFQVDSVDVLERIRAGENPFWIGIEPVKDYINRILEDSRPLTVHSKRENQDYVLYMDPTRGWKFSPT